MPTINKKQHTAAKRKASNDASTSPDTKPAAKKKVASTSPDTKPAAKKTGRHMVAVPPTWCFSVGGEDVLLEV